MKYGNKDIVSVELVHLLQKEQDAMARLRQVLDHETTLLTSTGNMEELSRLVSKKDRLIEELKALASQREAIHSAREPDTDFETFLQTQDDNQILLDLWRQLLSMTATCQEINQMNGAIIKLNDQHMRQAIRLLRNESPTDLNYDSRGGTAPARPSRLLGQA
ncbi:flagella synthesis protein FlgN [Thiolapillus sp.]